MKLAQRQINSILVACIVLLAISTSLNAQMHVDASGNVGVGTDTPAERLHVNDGNFEIEQTGAGVPAIFYFTTAASGWEIKQNGNTGRLTFRSSGATPFKFDPTATENLFRIGVLAPSTVDINGDLVITGTCTGCDAVLTPGWSLKSIEDHASEMYSDSFLPAVGPTPEGDVAINVFEKTTGILQELETAHIYIAQLNTALKELQSEVDKLKQKQ